LQPRLLDQNPDTFFMGYEIGNRRLKRNHVIHPVQSERQ
jgi:hypothetical protein